MLNIRTTIILCIYLVICACGVDVTDPQAGYFDDHTDKSGTQNFNNNGMGKMEVNINYNNGSSSTTIIPSPQTVNTTAQNYIIDGISFELIDEYLYATNLTGSNGVSCNLSYRGKTPKTSYIGDTFTWDTYEVSTAYIGTNKKDSCIIITALTCNETTNVNGFTGIKERSSWTGYSELCES